MEMAFRTEQSVHIVVDDHISRVSVRWDSTVLINKSHNNAVITNDVIFDCVYNHIVCAVCIMLY